MNYGLIGEKLGHSFSAEIHRQLFGYPYELKELPPTELESFFRDREFTAINITIPYKQAVLSLLDEVDETAARIGAVNTIVNRDGRLIGYNTDFLGLQALINRSGMDLQNKKVLILGSGGTSKTALAVAANMGCSQALRVSRNEKDGCISYGQAIQQYADADYIINTTPCGMYPNLGNSAIDISFFTSLQGVVDVVYNPIRTKLVCDALRQGIPAVGGLYMLVAQAAYAAELFTGSSVSAEKIESIYKTLFNEKQNIVLIGMPGCGKSTVGKLLAEQIDFSFVDTDDEIVGEENRSITQIFANDGEAYFRRVESSVIRRISAKQGCVIATGGGAILNPENIDLLRQNGRIYFLDRSLDNIQATSDRPLSSNRIALEQRYRERYDLYCNACDCHVKVYSAAENVAKQIREDLMK